MNNRPKLLDLFCGAGGAAMGYYRAGFDVVGVDIKPMPRYPFEFHQADALEYCAAHGAEFDAIHASPPCQGYTTAQRIMKNMHPDLISGTRQILKKCDRPYVIENVPGAPLINPVILNGALFGMLIHRPRLFECSFDIPLTLLPQSPPPVKMGRPIKNGDVIQIVGHFSNVPYARAQMGIGWMVRDELAEAIPPAYTEFIGAHLLKVITGASS